MLGLKLLRLILPPFHPFKYKYINWWFGKQVSFGAWFMNTPISFMKNKFTKLTDLIS